MGENFIATAWNNSQHRRTGGGYGIKILFEDRIRFFDQTWQTVTLHLNGYEPLVHANVAKDSFWSSTCGELIKKDIGIWLIRNGHSIWDIGNPPRVKMTVIGIAEFSVELI